MIIIILALTGLAGIVAGPIALLLNSWKYAGNEGADTARERRVWAYLVLGALVLGAVLAIAIWPVTRFMSYPVSLEPHPGRVFGIPFMVVYFDSEGHDYPGLLTLPAAIANSIFWLFIPQLVLRFFSRGPAKRERAQA
jgi:hypothetical protein